MNRFRKTAALCLFAFVCASCAGGASETSPEWGRAQVNEEIETIAGELGLERDQLIFSRMDLVRLRSCKGVENTDDHAQVRRAFVITEGSLAQAESLEILAARYRAPGTELLQYQIDSGGSRMLIVIDEDRGMSFRFSPNREGFALVVVAWSPCALDFVSRGDDRWTPEPVGG